MEYADCLCLGLDVGRSEAAIADPTKLVIKDIIPYFISADSFLDSAIFHLKRDGDAHGGFDPKQQGELVIGVGRESISGVLPLYLFAEHWEIARRKNPQIFGLMCTLDVMGYSTAQYFSVPYLVLLKCLEKAHFEKKEIFNRVSELVLGTC